MSFGFSVGDFITVLQLAKEIRQRFIDAPEQFKAISEDVKSLSNVLRDVDDVQSQQDLTSQQKQSLDEIAQGCHSVLDQLNKILDKYQELDSSAKGISGKSRKVWKRLQWDQKDIDQSRSRITLNIIAFDTFLGQITSNTCFAVRAGVDRLHDRLDDREYHEENEAILDWLTPVDYAPQQSDFIARRQKGTGQWLLESEKFQEWLTKSETLFCPGIPGAGKTIITSIVVDYLYSKFQNDAKVSIAYIYCNFRRQQEQKPEDLLASLLKQLVQQKRSMPDIIKNLYKYHKEKRTRPSIEEVSKALYSIVADYSKTFIIIDALDECQVANGSRKKLLSEILSLQTKIGISLFATSRFVPEIMKNFEDCVSLEILASDEDVQRYIDGHILQLPSFVSRSPDLQEEVKTEITKAVKGMFLLAQLHLNSLEGKRSAKAIKTALRKLPTGSEAYDYAYKEAMERIEGQIIDSQELAKQALSWITCAKRPLTMSELRHALAVEIGESKLDEENLPEIEDVLSVCAGLVTVDEESDVIRLVHYTTQEYFERTWTSWFPNAQKDITMVCVTYLLFEAFNTGFCLTDEDFEIRLQSNPLYDYAAKNWGHHVCATSTEVEQLILDLLGSEAKVSASSQAMMEAEEYRDDDYGQKVLRQVTGVHLAARFGLTEMITTLLKNGFHRDLKDGGGRTPLSWAAERGHEAVVRLLVERDDVEADSKGQDGQTPLSRAAAMGHEAIVRLLVERDDVEANSKDQLGRTPLLWAAERGHEAVVRLLVERDDVEADSKDQFGRTPLLWAAGRGHEAVVRLLVERDDVEADSKDQDGRTPLWLAAEWGHEAVVRLLVERDDVEADSKDQYGQTPLWLAAARGHEAVVRLLVERDDVEADSKDQNGRTPLWLAAARGHEAVVRLLVERDDVEADSKDRSGRTPLSWAAADGHEAVVRLLVERDDVEADSKNQDGQTPLSLAAESEHEAVVKLLQFSKRLSL